MSTRIWRNAVWLSSPPEEGCLCKAIDSIHYILYPPGRQDLWTANSLGCIQPGDMFMFVDYFQTNPDEVPVPEARNEKEFRDQYTFQAILCQGAAGSNVPNAGKVVYVTSHKTYLFSRFNVLVSAPDI